MIKASNMYFQNLQKSKMATNNLKNYLLCHIINTAESIMRGLLNLFCTSEPAFIR